MTTSTFEQVQRRVCDAKKPDGLYVFEKVGEECVYCRWERQHPDRAFHYQCPRCNTTGRVPTQDIGRLIEALADVDFFVKLVRRGTDWIAILFQGQTNTPWGDSGRSLTPFGSLYNALDAYLTSNMEGGNYVAR